MPGPAPKRHVRRRNPRPDWRALPAAGRAGAPPAWPLGTPRAEERALWAELWATPQAVAWEELGWTRAVARYAVCVLAAEAPGAPTNLLAEVRQLEDRLGLSPMAMRRLQWEIDGAAEAAASREELGDVARLEQYRMRAAR